MARSLFPCPLVHLLKRLHRQHSTATSLQHSLSFGDAYVPGTFVDPGLSVMMPLRSHHLVRLVILLKRPVMLYPLAATSPEDEKF